MQAGLTQLRILKEHPEIYKQLNEKADRFYTALDAAAAKAPQGYHINHIGSLGCLYFTKNPVVDYASAKTSDTEAFAAWFRYIFEKGYYIAPSQFEAMFLSAAHTEEELQRMTEAAGEYFAALA